MLSRLPGVSSSGADPLTLGVPQIGIGTFLGMYLSEHIRAKQTEEFLRRKNEGVKVNNEKLKVSGSPGPAAYLSADEKRHAALEACCGWWLCLSWIRGAHPPPRLRLASASDWHASTGSSIAV